MATASTPKTRHASSSHISDYLGAGKELVPSQVPTLRAALQLALHLREGRMRIEEVDKRNYPVSELMSDVTIAVMKQWEKANPQFKPPIICHARSMERNLVEKWERAILAARNKLNKVQRKDLESKLDILLDPLCCTCHPILLCKEAGCQGLKASPPCRLGAHLPSCSCPREKKIPQLELQFVKSQREKKSEKEGMQMGLEDFKEAAKQKKSNDRKEKAEQGRELQKTNKKKEEIELNERVEAYESLTLEEKEGGNEDEDLEGGKEAEAVGWGGEDPEPKRNTMDISRTAQTSMRYELSIRSTAAVTTAFLGDLIAAGELSPSKSALALDSSKLRRARDRVLADASELGETQTKEDSVTNVMFDSRIDATKVRQFDEETGRYYNRIENQDHYTLTDGDGRFLVHMTKPEKKEEEIHANDDTAEESQGEETGESGDEDISEEQEKKQKPAEVVARMIFDWLKLHGLTCTLQFLACDSTNSNTGWKAGIIAWLEKLLGSKITWLICQLHTNELGLRHLFQNLDGKTNSKTGWSGPLGQLLKTVDTMNRNYSFKQINLGPELVELPPEVMSDISTDQSQFYQLVQAVRSGILPRELALRKTGNMVHSRWLTFAEAVLLLWMSQHGLTGELLQRLETIVTYIVSVYALMWFRIKVHHSWLEGPRHVLTHLSLLKLQSPEVQRLLLPHLRTSSWYAHSEAILQTLLCSQDSEERAFAVAKILKMRGKQDVGKTMPRKRKLPELREEATQLQELIKWDRAHEPLLTCSLTKQEIKEFLKTPMKVLLLLLLLQLLLLLLVLLQLLLFSLHLLLILLLLRCPTSAATPSPLRGP